ncbi:S24 family peptidase [Delftia acidovorans]|uniref:S24 family peptidase n=1 Tax=Delftia acidovorans TaxID=80866 RepID=UPI00242EF10A|nr:S24 family peptidase [Delftia acidovorans]
MSRESIAKATANQVANALEASATFSSMDEQQIQKWRAQRLEALAAKEGGKAALGRRLGYRDGAFIGQMLRGDRPITEKTVLAVHAMPGYAGWFEPQSSPARVAVAIGGEDDPEFPAVMRVRFKLSAGASGFGLDYRHDLGAPIQFPRGWYDRHGFKPERLFATTVSNGSMEPGLYDGDTVIVNTAQTEPRDGRVFAVNYEGELVIKRLIRDDGQWWLSSDNPDQRRYPRKVCHDGVILIGEIVHKQSERI